MRFNWTPLYTLVQATHMANVDTNGIWIRSRSKGIQSFVSIAHLVKQDIDTLTRFAILALPLKMDRPNRDCKGVAQWFLPPRSYCQAHPCCGLWILFRSATNNVESDVSFSQAAQTSYTVRPSPLQRGANLVLGLSRSLEARTSNRMLENGWPPTIPRLRHDSHP